MAVMGKGSVRDKEKEDVLRKEGGKYAHLNEDLHVLVECYSEITDGYNRLSIALSELKKFVIPDLADGMYDGGEMGMNGAPRGRGGYRGGPPDRGGRGGFRGRGPVPGGRGALLSRGGGPPPRGAPRGAPSSRGSSRGATRGARPPVPAASYDGYSSQAYGSGYETYDDSYGQGYSSGQDTSYYDYGAGSSSAAAGYDAYAGGGYGDYSDSWSSGAKPATHSSRGGSRGTGRSHPYARTASGDY
uniref:K Homology domain-containing protein n=1 Tax=Arion vulgaris TaxID=1028688 RepID=A0A0B7A615_9EUPU